MLAFTLSVSLTRCSNRFYVTAANSSVISTTQTVMTSMKSSMILFFIVHLRISI